MPFYIYIIRSTLDETFYKGFTTDPERRLEEHNNGLSRYTSAKIPWELVYLEIHDDKTQALKREKVLKKYSHQQIIALITSGKNQLNNYRK